MERVAFLVESTGERLGCLLNPNCLVAQRSAGVETRRSAGGKLTGNAMSDDPLLYTGGGQTELRLDLLFDVSLGGSSIRTDDVRDLTRPLWDLAENARGADGYARPPIVRFVWGKSWNVPGLVTAVAERLEEFTSAGAPRRSWLRMRLLRVSDRESEALERNRALKLAVTPEPSGVDLDAQAVVHRVIGGGGTGEYATTERLEDIAWQYYGDPSAWRVIAAANDIRDPARIPVGTLLRIPPQTVVAALR